VCRSQKPINEPIKEKISLFCNVRRECVIQNNDVDCIYDVPLLLEQEGLAKLVCEKLGIPCPDPDLSEWHSFSKRRREAAESVDIALVGKYMDVRDAYMSVTEALLHAATQASLRVHIRWVSAESLEQPDSLIQLRGASGIIIPGGFGERGVPGMIQAARYARENAVPFLGINLGMHAAAIEYARNALNLPGAYSSEYCKKSPPVIDIVLDGAMRRGASDITLLPGTLIHAAYAEPSGDISERHRHRYGINPAFKHNFENAGLSVTALSLNGTCVEAFELSPETHPWFLGVQFHPEFKSRPNRPHPIFVDFIRVCQRHCGLTSF
jgi:CTP synthase